MPFADLFEDTAAAPRKSVTQQFGGYLPYLTQGCLVLLAIGIIVYFRSLAASPGAAKGGESRDTFETLLNTYQSQANGRNGTAGTRVNGVHPMPAVLTPNELSRLIRENPDNASHAL